MNLFYLIYNKKKRILTISQYFVEGVKMEDHIMKKLEYNNEIKIEGGEKLIHQFVKFASDSSNKPNGYKIENSRVVLNDMTSKIKPIVDNIVPTLIELHNYCNKTFVDKNNIKESINSYILYTRRTVATIIINVMAVFNINKVELIKIIEDIQQ